MTRRSTSFVRTRTVTVALLALMTILAWPQRVAAHTEFESSVPADGAVVEGPLAEIVLNFTNPARPFGDEFQLLDPSGEIRVPSAVDETDGTTFILSFDPPLGGGTYGLRWEVRAGDAHPLDGSFRFDVSVPTTTTQAPTTQATTTAAPTTTQPPAATAAPTTQTATTQVAPATTVAESSPTTAATIAPTPTSEPSDSEAALAAFLDGGDSGDDGEWLGRVGRTLTALGLIFGLGTATALMWVIRGRRNELVNLVVWVQLAGGIVVLGGVLEFAALQSAFSESVPDILTTKAGLAAALKIIGGVAVIIGFTAWSARFATPPRALSAAVSVETPAAIPDQRADSQSRWVPAGIAWLGLAGFATVLASFWFDGHTVSRGVWALHAVVNLVHLGAAAVWAGGVFAMTTVVWRRRRTGEPTGIAAMVVRFSTIAAVSLAAVIAAGVVMAIMILDRPGDVVDTDWGRLLIAKTAVVAVAAGLGAFNHFRLRPALEQRPDDPGLARELRVSLTIESIAFVVVVVLTSWLVVAAI